MAKVSQKERFIIFLEATIKLTKQTENFENSVFPGNKVIENVSVTGIETKLTLLGSTEVTTVLTDAGPIKTR